MTTIQKLLPCRDEVAIDANHINLIASLVVCSKPKSILELGIGSGSTTSALMEAIAYNRNDAKLTCVDNFNDWDGFPPSGVFDIPVELIVKSERDFIAGCTEKYSFIVSDADHDRSHEWAVKTLALLDDGGIAVFHDVCNPSYSNLASIVGIVEWAKLPHIVFNQSSRDDERCDRGLLVVFKPKV